jgi:O-antigen/teichoic acid export membrane protein
MSKNLFFGLTWSVIEILLKRLLDIVVRLVLARLLFPEDFGIVGMATVFHSIVQAINESGFGMALIQRKKEELTDDHYHTAFWSNLVWSIILYLLFSFVVGPFAAYFYNEPVLKLVMPVLGLSILFSALNTIHKAQLLKNLELKKMAFVNSVSAVVSGITSIVLAFLDFGVWALVLYNVLTFLVSVPLFFRATKWLPELIWKKKEFKEILGFGLYTTGTKVINSISSNIDYLVIGKMLSAAALGTYSLAFMLTNLIRAQIESMLNRVLFPFYSSIQNDLEKMKSYYLRMIRYYAVIIYPLMSVLILVTLPFIQLFFGNKWEDAAASTKILAWAAVVSVICSGYNILFRSIGKPKMEMNLQFLTAILIYIPAVIIGVKLNGVIGVAYGILFASIIRVVVIQILLKRFFGINLLDVLSALKSPILVFAFTCGTFLLITYFLILNVYSLLAIILLLNIVFSVLFLRKDIKIFKNMLTKSRA